MKIWEVDGRDNSDLDKMVEEFTAGADVGYDQRLADYDLYGSIAHVTGLEEIGLLSGAEAEELRSELRKLLSESIQLSPEDEDVHTRVENELTESLGELGAKLHTARSRNDQVLVDLRLYEKDYVFKLVEEIVDLAETLLGFAEEEADTPMVGYTHSRKAMPSSVGLWSAGYAEALLDGLIPLDSAFKLIDQSPLGVGAGYGVPVKLDRELTADQLGFGSVQNNAIYVMNSRGKFEYHLLSALGGITLELSRLAEDLISFSDEQFGYFKIPEEFTTGSSIMPQKKNPDVLELVRGRTAVFSGKINELYNVLQGLRSGYSRDLQETKRAMMEGLDTVSGCLQVLQPLIANLEVNESNLLSEFSGEVFATDQVFSLVKEGQPFREAYRKVKQGINQKDQEENVSLEKVREALESRQHQGGPGNLKLEEGRAELKRRKKKWMDRSTNFRMALENLGEKELNEEGG